MEEKKVAVPPAAETGEEELIEQAKIRREKLDRLIAEGKNPYEKVKFPRTHCSADILNRYEALEGQTVSVAGRILSRRLMGKVPMPSI